MPTIDEEFINAIYMNKGASLGRLLPQITNVDLTTDFGRTALMYAAHEQDLDLLVQLLSRHANVSLADQNGRQALDYACIDSIDGIAVDLLVKAGADVGYSDNKGNTPLLVAVRNISSNDRREDLARLKILLKAGANVNHYNYNGRTALMLAARKGDVKLIDFLLTHGAEVNYVAEPSKIQLQNQMDYNPPGSTAIMLAAESGNLMAVQTLLRAGADINALDDKNYSLLNYALRSRNPEVVSFLIENGLEVDHRDSDGLTVLELASHDSYDIADCLLQHGADPNRLNPAFSGRSLLMLAAKDLDIKMVELLLKHGADIDYKSPKGESVFSVSKHTHVQNMLKQHEAKERKTAVSASIALSRLEKGVPNEKGETTKKPYPEDIVTHISTFLPKHKAIRKGVRALRERENKDQNTVDDTHSINRPGSSK